MIRDSDKVPKAVAVGRAPNSLCDDHEAAARQCKEARRKLHFGQITELGTMRNINNSKHSLGTDIPEYKLQRRRRNEAVEVLAQDFSGIKELIHITIEITPKNETNVGTDLNAISNQRSGALKICRVLLPCHPSQLLTECDTEILVDPIINRNTP
jgi:hypothetical protein